MSGQLHRNNISFSLLNSREDFNQLVVGYKHVLFPFESLHYLNLKAFSKLQCNAHIFPFFLFLNFQLIERNTLITYYFVIQYLLLYSYWSYTFFGLIFNILEHVWNFCYFVIFTKGLVLMLLHTTRNNNFCQFFT